MEAIFAASSSADRSLSPYKHIMKNPQGNMHHHHLISSRHESLPPMSNNNNVIYNGILYLPNRSVSFSLPPYPISVSYFNFIQQLQPPLLPLPEVKPCNNVKTKGNKKISKSPKKQAGNPTSILKKPGSSQDLSSKVLLYDSSKKDYGLESSISDLSREFSGSLYAVSPPPSSLPLPKFTIIRPSKISCKAEAAARLRQLQRFTAAQLAISGDFYVSHECFLEVEVLYF